MKQSFFIKNSHDMDANETSEVLNTIKAFQKGEKNANKRLYKCVEKGFISIEDYNELIEKFGATHRINKEKKEKERLRKIKHILYSVASLIVLFVSMLCTLSYIVVRDGKGVAVWYLILWLWAFNYAIITNKYSKSDLIAKLELENEILKENLETCKYVCKELESKLKDTPNNSQQE